MSATGIDRDYGTASPNNNKIDTNAYERPKRRDAEDSDSNGVTDTVGSYSQSQAETLKVASDASFSARLKRAVNSNDLAEAILRDSVRRYE